MDRPVQLSPRPDGSQRVVFQLPEDEDFQAAQRPVRPLPSCYAAPTFGFQQIDGSCRRKLMPRFRPELFTAVKPRIQSVLQVLLREHGFHDLTDVNSAAASDISLFFCSGFLETAPFDVRTLRPHQKVNRLPGVRLLSGKASLWQSYVEARNKFGRDAFDFCPDHFVLPGELQAFEAHMRAQLAEREEAEGEVWILKPDGTFATFGNGIFLHRPTLDSGWGGAVVTREVRQHRGVACKYIDPPFLLDGLKFDLRIYVLVTSVRPLSVYIYEEGLARFATRRYDAGDLDERCAQYVAARLDGASPSLEPPSLDAALLGRSPPARVPRARPLYACYTLLSPLALVCTNESSASVDLAAADTCDDESHACSLTNYTLNKHSSDFDGSLAEDCGSKWSLSALRRRMLTELGVQRSEAMWAQVDDLVVKTIIAAEPGLTSALHRLYQRGAEGAASTEDAAGEADAAGATNEVNQALRQAAGAAAAANGAARHFYQLLGFDVMLDSAAKPWLLEVNVDPSLGTLLLLDPPPSGFPSASTFHCRSFCTFCRDRLAT